MTVAKWKQEAIRKLLRAKRDGHGRWVVEMHIGVTLPQETFADVARVPHALTYLEQMVGARMKSFWTDVETILDCETQNEWRSKCNQSSKK